MRAVNASSFDALADAVLRLCNRTDARRISRKTQELIVQNVLEKLHKRGELVYFGKMLSRKGFLRSITSLTDQLGLCGVPVGELAGAMLHWEGRSETGRQKDREIVSIYANYREYLGAHNIFDMQGLYRLAVNELSKMQEQGVSLPWKTLYFLGFYQFDALQLEMIRMLSRMTEVTVALPYEPERPELYGAAEYTFGELMQSAELVKIPRRLRQDRPYSLQQIMQGLRNPGCEPAEADGGIEIWQASGQEEEIRSVLRSVKIQIRDNAVKAGQVALVVRDPDRYSGIRALCDEYGIPVQTGGTALLSSNPLFNYVLLLLKQVYSHGREQAEDCIAFFAQPLQRLVLGFRTDAVTQAAARKYFTDCQAFFAEMAGTADCGTAENLWQQIRLIPKEATIAEYCGIVAQILTSLDFPLKMGQLYKNNSITLAEFKNIICAHQEILSLLQKMPGDYYICQRENDRVPCQVFRDALAEAAETVSVSLQPENQEGISVLSAANLENVSYKQVYVLGIREKEFPFLKRENWIYNDKERNDLAALGIILPAASDGYQEDIHFFANACAAAEERLVLTFYTDEEKNASPYIHEVRALFTDLAVLPAVKAGHPEDSLSPEELEAALATRDQTGILHRIMEPGVLAAACSDRYRMANETGWNGMLRDDGLRGQVGLRIGSRFSASKLESYRKCPFQFLVTYVWRQRAVEEAGETADPMQSGNLLHKVLERFAGNHLGERFTADREEALGKELQSVFSGVCQEMAAAGQIYAGDFWEHDKEIYRSMLSRWLKNEIAYSGAGDVSPLYTEKEFGKVNHEEFSLVTDAGRVFLNGKIDRIDRIGNRIFITDYKSGKAPGKKDFLDKDLQMPVYLLAAEKLADGAAVCGGGYYMIKEGNRKESFVFQEEKAAVESDISWKTYSEISGEDGSKIKISSMRELRNETEKTVGALLYRMKTGDFMPAPESGCDQFCPAAKICRYKVLVQDREKEDQDGDK